MAPRNESALWGSSPRGSDVTAGFWCWLDEVARMWRARQCGQRVMVPTVVLFLMYFCAAFLAAVCYACDRLVLAINDGVRGWVEDRRAHRMVRDQASGNGRPIASPSTEG